MNKIFFVNIHTGEIVEGECYLSPFVFPLYNTDGWSVVTEEKTKILLRRVYDYGWVMGVQDEIMTNEPDYVELQHRMEYDNDHR